MPSGGCGRLPRMPPTAPMKDADALDQIAATLGLYTTNPGANPPEEVISAIVGFVQQTGRPTNVPEGA